MISLLLAQSAPSLPSSQAANPVAIVFVLLLGIVAVSIVIYLFRRTTGGASKPGPDPTCGHCGYAVTGLTTFTCPECGSDLRDAGIKPAARPRGASAPASAVPNPSAARTVTILLTDMKDYTSRAEASSREEALRLVRRQHEMVQPIVQRRGGRIIKSTGDGLIVSFDSATEALLAGLEVQQSVELHNLQSFHEQDRFQLRIAVSTGEVTFVENDLFGQPVNLASRVQQLIEPGEVCFTDATYHAMNRREVACETVGPVQLKGVADPVNLYRCIRPPTPSAESSGMQDATG